MLMFGVSAARTVQLRAEHITVSKESVLVRLGTAHSCDPLTPRRPPKEQLATVWRNGCSLRASNRSGCSQELAQASTWTPRHAQQEAPRARDSAETGTGERADRTHRRTPAGGPQSPHVPGDQFRDRLVQRGRREQ